MTNLTIKDYATSATSVIICWKRQKSWPKSAVISYRVTYEPLEAAGITLEEKTPLERVLLTNVTELNITGLSSYTIYKVVVTPLTRSGNTMQSSYIFVGKIP